MATIQNLPNTAVNTTPTPANPHTATAPAAAAAVAKGVAASPTQVNMDVKTDPADVLAPVTTYAMDEDPPLSGEAGKQAVNQLQQEVTKLTPDQIDSVLQNLFSLLAELFSLLKKTTMQSRALEVQNQFDATMAAANKLRESAADNRSAALIGAIVGIAAGLLSSITAGMGVKAGWNSKKLVSEYKTNNNTLNQKTDTLKPKTLDKEPTFGDAIEARQVAQEAPNTKIDIKTLENSQGSLKLQIDQKNNMAQSLTQGGTAIGGLINSVGGVFSTNEKYDADIETSEAKEKDAAAQKASAAAEDNTNFMQTAAQKFAEVIQTWKDMIASQNNTVQTGIKNIV